MDEMRLFSQEGEMSQLTGQCERIAAADEDSQPISESQFSTRAQAIVQENRHLDNIVESQLLAFEKRRMLLANKVIEVKQHTIKYKDTRECQSQDVLKLQMSLEEITEQYQVETRTWPKLEDKVMQLQAMMSYLKDNFSKGISVGSEIKEFKEHIFIKFEESLKRDISAQKAKIVNYNKSKIEHEIDQSKEAKSAILKQREEKLDEIQGLAQQHFNKANSISNTHEQINVDRSDLELKTSELNEIINKKKFLTEELRCLHQQQDEYRMGSAGQIQNLKLQLNNEKNLVFNLEEKFKDKEFIMNNLTFKLNEAFNLANQMKTSVDEIIQRNQAHIESIDEIKNKNETLTIENASLATGIQPYEIVVLENVRLKDNIVILSKSIEDKKNIFLVNEEHIQDLAEQVVKGRASSSQLEEIINGLQYQYNNTKSNFDNLFLKFEKDNRDQLIERESKMLRNETLEKECIDQKSLFTTLSLDLKETENVNIALENQREEIEQSIEEFNNNIAKSDQEIKQLTEEWEIKYIEYNERLKLKDSKLKHYLTLLNEAKPIQEQKPVLLDKKSLLDEELKVLTEMQNKEMENLKNNNSSEIMEMDKAMVNLVSILEKLLFAEDQAAEKYTEDSKQVENTKLLVLEKELKMSNDIYDRLKYAESVKRHSIAKMERRLKTITREVKVSHEDISNAVSGKVQEVHQGYNDKRPTMKHKLMTPSNSSYEEPPTQKMYLNPKGDQNQQFQIPVASKKANMDLNTMEDEYEFSEI